MISLRTLALTVGLASATIVGSTPREASAMMQDVALEGGGGGGGTYEPAPTTNNKVVYLHGRSMNGWPVHLQSTSDWTHVTLSYNGSARISDSNVRTTVKNAIAANCRGANQCAIVCYSAGCARMLYAFDELAAAGTPADRVTWITATASAAGGTETADAATKWFAKVLSKIFGGGAAIDEDLKVNAMRSNYGFIQNRAPVAMYHLAGSKNMCRKIWFVKLCGNKYLPGSIGDGAVPPHSACGFAARGYYPNCNGAYGAKYSNRLAEQDALYALDHRGMVGKGIEMASYRLGRTATLDTGEFGEVADPDADLTYDDGDLAAARTDQVTDTLGGSPDPNVVASDSCEYNSTCYTPSEVASTGSGGGGGGGELVMY